MAQDPSQRQDRQVGTSFKSTEAGVFLAYHRPVQQATENISVKTTLHISASVLGLTFTFART